MRSIRVLALAFTVTAAVTGVACNLYIGDGGGGSGGSKIKGGTEPDAGTKVLPDGGVVYGADATIGGPDAWPYYPDGGPCCGGPDAGSFIPDAVVYYPDAEINLPDAKCN